MINNTSAARHPTVGVRAIFGRFGRSPEALNHAAQQARIQTLNRYGITTYDFGTRYLQQGCVGDDVAQLQNYLREEGIMRGDDAYPGYYGEVTETAVVKWQQRHDLPATGAFGDLARETYIQKQVLLSGCVAQHVQELLSTQERRMQSTLSASDGISVLQDGSANHMPGGLAGSVLSGLLLAAATYAAVVQVRSWIERRQGDWLAGVTAMLPPFVAGWLGRAPAAPEPLFGEPLGDDAGMEALWNLPAAEPVLERAAPKPAPAAVQSAHGTYFRAGGMAEIRKEIQSRRAEEGTATLELPPQPSRARVERPQRTPPTPAVAEPGTYFGGTVKRPQFPNAKGRIQLTRKADTEAQTAVARAAPEPTKTAAWDAWTSPAEEEEAAEVAPVPAWEQQPADAPDTSRVTLGAPVRDSLTWSAARETAVEPRRSVQPDDVMTLVKRLASKKPAQPQKGEGEIWVSNTRFSADGTPAEQPPSGSRSPLGGGPLTRPRSTGGDYVMTTNATPKPLAPPQPAPLPPRSTTAPLQAALLGKKNEETSG